MVAGVWGEEEVGMEAVVEAVEGEVPHGGQVEDLGVLAALLVVRPCEVVAAPLRHSSPWVPCLGEGEGGRTAVAFRTCLHLRTG